MNSTQSGILFSDIGKSVMRFDVGTWSFRRIYVSSGGNGMFTAVTNLNGSVTAENIYVASGVSSAAEFCNAGGSASASNIYVGSGASSAAEFCPKSSGTTLTLHEAMVKSTRVQNFDTRATTVLRVIGEYAFANDDASRTNSLFVASRNYGSVEVTGDITVNGSVLLYPNSGQSSGPIKANGVVNNSTAGAVRLATDNAAYSGSWEIGAGGLRGGTFGYVVRAEDVAGARLNPLADYTISTPVAVSNTLWIGTTCATNDKNNCTVTVAAPISGTGELVATGTGALCISNDCDIAPEIGRAHV